MTDITRRSALKAAPAVALTAAVPALWPSPVDAAPDVPAAQPDKPKAPRRRTSSSEPHPILALPFVRDATRAERAAGMAPRIFWSVTPTGNYTDDCNTGCRYAHLALDYMVRNNAPCIMQWAVFDMMRAGPEHSGVEVGFLSVFGTRAARWYELTALPIDADLTT